MTRRNDYYATGLFPFSRFFEAPKLGETFDNLAEASQVSRKSTKTDTHKVLYYSLPGVEMSRINLEFKDGDISLEVAPISEEKLEGNNDYHAFPRGYKTSDYVGLDVDPDNVEAASENGILKVSFAIKESVTKKSIPINTKQR